MQAQTRAGSPRGPPGAERPQHCPLSRQVPSEPPSQWGRKWPCPTPSSCPHPRGGVHREAWPSSLWTPFRGVQVSPLQAGAPCIMRVWHWDVTVIWTRAVGGLLWTSVADWAPGPAPPQNNPACSVGRPARAAEHPLAFLCLFCVLGVIVAQKCVWSRSAAWCFDPSARRVLMPTVD